MWQAIIYVKSMFLNAVIFVQNNYPICSCKPDILIFNFNIFYKIGT